MYAFYVLTKSTKLKYIEQFTILKIVFNCTIWFSFTISYLLYLCLAQQKLNINENEPIKVVLESDGTEIDEEDYFETLESNTLIMILKSDQKWGPYGLRYTKLLMFLFYLQI